MTSALFPCTMCGACCKSIGTLLARKGETGRYSKEIDEFPYAADEKGVCEKYSDKGCSVYADRPDLCNVETMRNRHFPDMKRSEFFNMNVSACHALIDELKMDASMKPKHIN